MRNERFPKLIGVKVPADLAKKIQRAAREDDRTVSSYLRRHLASTLDEPKRAEPPDESEPSDEVAGNRAR